jgi:hypothetical protein
VKEGGGMKQSIDLRIVIVVVVLLAAIAQQGIAQTNPSSVQNASWRLSFTATFDETSRSANLLLENASKQYKNGIDVQRNYFSRPPLADFSIEAGSALPGVRGFGVAARVAVKPEWQGDYFRSDNLPFANGATSVEGNLFSRSVVYWKTRSAGIAFGRDRVDYNGILEGGLLSSSRIPWYDALRGYGKLGRFSLDSIIATIPAVKAWDGNDVPLEPGYGFETDKTPTTIVEAMSKITWTFGPQSSGDKESAGAAWPASSLSPGQFSLSAADHAMLARYNNRFYLTDLFPLISRHQASVPQTNNSMVLTAAWQPFSWLALSVQAGFDDINLNGIGVSDTATPTIDAYVLGARFAAPLKIPAAQKEQKAQEKRGLSAFNTEPAVIHAYIEAGSTHWLWGNYDGSQAQPNDVNYFLRFIYRYPRYLGGSILLPLTSPYGPGVRWISSHGEIAFGRATGARQAGASRWGFSLGYRLLFLDLNTEANLIDTKVYNNTTTENAPRSYNVLASIPISLTFGALCGTIEPAYLWHDGQSAFELEMSLSYRILAGTYTGTEQ